MKLGLLLFKRKKIVSKVFLTTSLQQAKMSQFILLAVPNCLMRQSLAEFVKNNIHKDCIECIELGICICCYHMKTELSN